jgi:phosphohistidine phosphatase
MNLYILRHAVAVQRGSVHYPNDDRPLTKEGIEKMQKEAECFPWLIRKIDSLFTSPLSRAKETAEIAAKSLNAEKKIMITDALLLGADEDEIFELLNREKDNENVMIVGHEPHLSFTASSLLGTENSVIELKKGALCFISINGTVKRGNGQLRWLLQPKQLRAMGKV